MDETPGLPLEHVADAVVSVGTPITVGDSGEGIRRVVPILGGTLDGHRLHATVLAAGADYQLIRPDGIATLDARYVAQTDDGTMLYIVNTGIRYGTPETIRRLTRGENVDPALVYFRSAPRFETVSPEYQWLMQSLFVATGIRRPDHVELRIYRVG